MSRPILSVRDLTVRFGLGRGLFGPDRVLTAIDGVSFDLSAGETLGIVGESGSGKSTLGRAVLRLIPAEAGQIVWLGQDLRRLGERAMRPLRRDLQIVFQDPLAALDPRATIFQSVAEPLATHRPEMTRAQMRDAVSRWLARVGLDDSALDRYPHEFSGGQCQRIGIARAMILEPRLIVCDEAVSALDVSIQAQIVNLLAALQRETGVALLFISHNLAVVRHLSHRILVLYLGRVAEIGPAEALFADPCHPYTRALLAAVPPPDPFVARARRRAALTGEPPSPLNPPSGCAFRTRCPLALDICASAKPTAEAIDDGARHLVACHRWRDRSTQGA